MHRLRVVPILLVLALLLGGIAACSTPEPAAQQEGQAAGEQQVAEQGMPEEGQQAEQGVEEQASQQGQEAAEEEPAEEEAAAEEEMPEEGSLGQVVVPEGEPIRLAALLVMTGPNGVLGEDSRDGIEIAIDDFGPIMDHEVELVTEDTQCTPEGGQVAATKVAADPTIVGVVGTTCSSAAQAAIPMITDAGLVMISPSNTAPDLTDPDRPPQFAGYLRTAHNDLFQGRVAAEFAYNELGLTKAATIHDGSVYAEQLQKVFSDVFTDLGGEIVAQEAVNVGDTEMGPVLENIATAEPEIIYFPIFTAEGGLITDAARSVPGLEDVVLMGADGLFSQDYVEAAGDAAVGVYISGPHVAGEAYDTFLAKLEEKYGRGPLSGYHAHAYDATMIILNAIDKVAEVDDEGNLVIDRAALRDAVYDTKDYQGLTGTLTCQSEGNPGDCATGEALAVFQITEDTVAGEWPPPVVYQP